MLSELDKILLRKEGIASIQYDSVLSPMFLYLHFIEDYMKNEAQVIFVSIHSSLEFLKIICGKMAIRIEPQKFSFFSLKDVLNSSLNNNITGTLFENILKLVKLNKKILLIIDDLDSLKTFLSPKSELQFLLRLKKSINFESLILVSYTEWNPIYRNVFNTRFRIAPIGTGFGKNLTGELEIEQLNPFEEARSNISKFHYFVGDRNVRLFAPGSAQLLM